MKLSIERLTAEVKKCDSFMGGAQGKVVILEVAISTLVFALKPFIYLILAYSLCSSLLSIGEEATASNLVFIRFNSTLLLLSTICFFSRGLQTAYNLMMGHLATLYRLICLGDGDVKDSFLADIEGETLLTQITLSIKELNPLKQSLIKSLKGSGSVLRRIMYRSSC